MSASGKFQLCPRHSAGNLFQYRAAHAEELEVNLNGGDRAMIIARLRTQPSETDQAYKLLSADLTIQDSGNLSKLVGKGHDAGSGDHRPAIRHEKLQQRGQ